MNNLIEFSLRRRFLTPTFAIITAIFSLIAGTCFFADRIINTFFPALFNQPVLYLDNNYFASELESEFFRLKYTTSESKQDLFLTKIDNVYTLNYQDDLTPKIYQNILIFVQELEYQELMRSVSPSNLILIEKAFSPEINLISTTNNEFQPLKQDLALFVLSSAYFFVLGFCTLIANEVVNEKSNRVMELILISVSATTHFISKIIIGWLSITLHLIINSFIIIFFFIIRNFFDQGVGLLALFHKFKLLSFEILTFKDLILSLKINPAMLLNFFLIVCFLMLGVLLTQIILVVLSSFVSTIEEAGAIAGPTYIILLLVYYLALVLNSPTHLNQGLGYILSFVPFFSMLFMPCRLILGSINPLEVLISLIVALMTLIITVIIGQHFYKKGVLSYQRKRPLFFKGL